MYILLQQLQQGPGQRSGGSSPGGGSARELLDSTATHSAHPKNGATACILDLGMSPMSLDHSMPPRTAVLGPGLGLAQQDGGGGQGVCVAITTGHRSPPPPGGGADHELLQDSQPQLLLVSQWGGRGGGGAALMGRGGAAAETPDERKQKL